MFSRYSIYGLLFLVFNVFAAGTAQDSAIKAGIHNYYGDYRVTYRIRHLKWLAQNHSWEPLKLKRLLVMGDTDPVLSEISKRLMLLGDLDYVSDQSDHFDLMLFLAVKQFQKRHGLTVDGIIGPKTLKWLNVKPSERVHLLATNAADKAKLLTAAAKRYLLVNIPAFELILSDGGREMLRSRVIVGKPLKPTPILKGVITSVVRNPSWRVPRSILIDDLLPLVQRDGSYITKKEFEVFDAAGKRIVQSPRQWSRLARGDFPYRLEQKPGVRNTLGQFKFYFPNRHSVYLHDTVSPELFNKNNRALSSGCIRVEKAAALADWIATHLIKDKKKWLDLQALGEREDTRWFALLEQLPLYLVYWTAWVDDTGLSHFRDDIYELHR